MDQVQYVRGYFQSEQNESIAFIMIGLILIAGSVALAIYFRSKFSIGSVFSIVPIGIVQIIVGGTIYLRSPEDIMRVEKYFSQNELLVDTIEVPRVQEVLESFEIYRWTEASLCIVGILLILVFRKGMVKGIGFGLALQALIMLILDLFAELRAEVYLQQLIESGL